jgi:hypothetical protein
MEIDMRRGWEEYAVLIGFVSLVTILAIAGSVIWFLLSTYRVRPPRLDRHHERISRWPWRRSTVSSPPGCALAMCWRTKATKMSTPFQGLELANCVCGCQSSASSQGVFADVRVVLADSWAR